MERYKFKQISVPAEVYDELGFTDSMVLEAYVKDGRLVIGKADIHDDCICPCEDFDERYDGEFEECDDCLLCCPECGACLRDYCMTGEDDEDEQDF